MEDDYIIEEESTGTQGSGSSNRPFLTAVGILLFIFILAAGCAAVSLMNRGGGGNEQAAQATSIAATNEAILAANARVTETIAAMETEAARPTDTPTPPPPTFTPVPSPTNTPIPTNTPVVVDVVEETEGEAAGTPNVSGTSVFETGADGSTPTPIPVVSGGSGSLPDTGFELWAIILAAAVLVGILVAARKMRGA